MKLEDDNRRGVRVLLISHTCQSRAAGQMKAARLAAFDDVQLRVVVPDRWRDDYGHWRGAEPPVAESFEYSPLKVRWPHLGPLKRYAHWYPALGKTIREFRPDVIDIWEEPWGLVSAHVCRLRNRLLPAARIISETEQNLDKRLPFPFAWMRKYSLKNADYAVARNREAISVIRAHGYDGPAEVIPNAVDTELFKPLDRAACRRDLAFTGFIAGYVGRLVPEKGLMNMIEALAGLPEDVRIAFVGSGPMRQPLEQRAMEMGKADRVIFLAGRPLEQLPSVMNALDALVLPSLTTPAWKEQFGRVIIEAHACATPVIGSNSGAIPDVVDEGGLIFPEGQADALARAIIALREHPERCRQMGRAGLRQVEQFYTWECVAGRMRDIYLKLAEPSPGPVRQAADALDSQPSRPLTVGSDVPMN